MGSIGGFLKYFGLVLAAVSSVWGTLNDVTTKDATGRKLLTSAGRWALGFTMVGLLTTMTTTYIEGVQHQQSEISRLRQTIYSTQPLQSVTIEWSFPELAPETLKKISDARQEGENTMRKFSAENRHHNSEQYYDASYRLDRGSVLLPILNSLGGGPWQSASAVALFALDDTASTVLPLGGLSDDLARSRTESTTGSKRANTPIEVASGIDIDLGVNAGMNIGGGPWRKRSLNSQESAAVVQTNANGLTILWKLPASDYLHAIDKVDPLLVPTAKLPDRMRVMILTRIKILPVDPAAMTTIRFTLPWQAATTTDVTPSGFRNSKLTVTPNGVTDASATYNMRLVSVTSIEDSETKPADEDPNVEYCYAALWSGERLSHAH